MLDWYRTLDRDGRRTFWACFSGYALDAMDVQIYSFVVPVLIGLWGMTNTQAGALATVTLILSAAGGWIAGLLADRIGRVRSLQITVAWFAVFTFLSGFTNSFEQLLVTRGLQGLGFGGEWAAGSVLMGEVIAARHRGKAVGVVQSSWSVGWGIAALAATTTSLLLPKEYAWRVLFFMGLVPAFSIFVIRRLVPEPASIQRPRRTRRCWRSSPAASSASPRAAACWRLGRRAVTMPSPPGCRPTCGPKGTCPSWAPAAT